MTELSIEFVRPEFQSLFRIRNYLGSFTEDQNEGDRRKHIVQRAEALIELFQASLKTPSQQVQ